MSSAPRDEVLEDSDAAQQNPGIQAAVARTLTRGLALYFSRPVRLFRPSKINGWQSLRSMAEHQGVAYDHRFLFSAIKLQGFDVIRKHFLPPMVVNAMLGTVLWTTYAESYSIVGPAMPNHPVFAAAVSGGIAGGFQALLAAPVENVRLAIEGGAVAGHTWTQAWKDLVRDSLNKTPAPHKVDLQEARELRAWVKEVGEMAGRGWNGWGWSCAKDVCAFSAFFAIFEVTRTVGNATKSRSEDFLSSMDRSGTWSKSFKGHLPRIFNSVILVTGGVLAGLAYELICRPWDKARRLIYLRSLTSDRAQVFKPILDAMRAEGPATFFRDPNHEQSANPSSRGKLTGTFRTLGRVGPWGIGFLVWEMYRPGLPS